MHKIFLSLICALCITAFLAGCSGDEQAKAKSESPYDPQLKALEKAQQVEQLIQDEDKKTREEMQRQGL